MCLLDALNLFDSLPRVALPAASHLVITVITEFRSPRRLNVLHAHGSAMSPRLLAMLYIITD